jgi:hypothetical protein
MLTGCLNVNRKGDPPIVMRLAPTRLVCGKVIGELAMSISHEIL